MDLSLTIDSMDYRVQKAVNAIREALRLNSDTVAAYVAGSHARGAATKHSDLDVYHVVRGEKWNGANWSIIWESVGDMNVDVVVDSMESIGRTVNVYGSFEYQAARDGIILYSDGSADWYKILSMIKYDVCLPECAPKWFNLAKQFKDAGDHGLRTGRRLDNMGICMYYRRSAYASIMAMLTHDDIKFEYTKRLTDLAGILRDGSVISGHELSVFDDWVPSFTRSHKSVPVGELLAAARVAQSIYDAADEYIHVV